MKAISRHPVLYSPLSKVDRTQLLHSCFRVHLSSSHVCCFTKKEARSQKLITWNYTTWNVIRDCKSTKMEHSKKRTTSLPTWTMIYWLKQRKHNQPPSTVAIPLYRLSRFKTSILCPNQAFNHVTEKGRARLML